MCSPTVTLTPSRCGAGFTTVQLRSISPNAGQLPASLWASLVWKPLCQASFAEEPVFKVIFKVVRVEAGLGSLFFLMAESRFLWKLDHILFICPTAEGPLSCCHLLTMVDSGASNICVHLFVQTLVFRSFGYMLSGGRVGPPGNSVKCTKEPLQDGSLTRYKS